MEIIGKYTKSLIPTLTSNTSSPPIIINRSSRYSTTTESYYLFDGIFSGGNCWQSWGYMSYGWGRAVSGFCWISIDFNILTSLYKYKIQSVNDNTTSNPTAWLIDGSLDNINWYTLDIKTAQTFTLGESKLFTLATPGYFRYYRLVHIGTTPSSIRIAELFLYNEQFSTSYIGAYETLLTSETVTFSGGSSGVFTVPTNCTSLIVNMCGGGGGGARGFSGNYYSGGGGGGGSVAHYSLTVTSGQNINYSVGNGGNGTSTVMGIGTNGGNTSFGSLLAYGGKAPVTYTNCSGVGGNATNGTNTSNGASSVTTGNPGSTATPYWNNSNGSQLCGGGSGGCAYPAQPGGTGLHSGNSGGWSNEGGGGGGFDSYYGQGGAGTVDRASIAGNPGILRITYKKTLKIGGYTYIGKYI